MTRPRKAAGEFARPYGIPKATYKHFRGRLLDQVRDCATDEARRLLLGISQKQPEGVIDQLALDVHLKLEHLRFLKALRTASTQQSSDSPSEQAPEGLPAPQTALPHSKAG